MAAWHGLAWHTEKLNERQQQQNLTEKHACNERSHFTLLLCFLNEIFCKRIHTAYRMHATSTKTSIFQHEKFAIFFSFVFFLSFIETCVFYMRSSG